MMSAAGKTSKLKNYRILEAFVQCNFLDGFDYIDKAGKLVNGFVRKNKKVPDFKMDLNGLKIQDISDTVKELKISSNEIWIHFTEPKNIGVVATEANELIEQILKVLKPTIFKKIGWRTYFAREDLAVGIEDPAGKLKLKKSIGGYNLSNVVLAKEYNDFHLRLEITPAANAVDPTKKALLFDVDLVRETEKLDAKKTLDEIRQALRSDDLLDSFEELVNHD